MKDNLKNLSPPFEIPLMPFIVGAPRSGTTLLRLMLDAHSEIAIPPETGFFSLLNKLGGSGASLSNGFYECIVNFGKPSSSWGDFGIEREYFRQALDAIEPFSVVEGLRTFYCLYAGRFHKNRYGDKTPMYCKLIPKIRSLLPEARFIHLIRDGRDVALSLRKMWFSPGWSMKSQATHWQNCVKSGRDAGVGEADYIEVRYEDLVLKPRETLSIICAFIDLELQEPMFRYHERASFRLQEHKGRYYPDGRLFLSHEARLMQQHRTAMPLDEKRVFVWKKEMIASERKEYELIAGGLLTDLGYEIE